VLLFCLSAAQVGTNAATIEKTRYGGRPAYRLSDGHSEAVVVPEIGRVMRFGLVGGPNWLWNAPPRQTSAAKPGQWRNFGGDKTWTAPQSLWPVLNGANWPPDPVWDGAPHRAELLPGARLRLISPISAFNGARVIHEYAFGSNGDFEVAQTVEKRCGAPVMLSIWSVTQIALPDAIFLPLNADSPYKNNFHWIARPRPDPEFPGLWQAFSTARNSKVPDVLRVRPLTDASYKIGVDAPVASIVAVREDEALLLRAEKPQGVYPDGAVEGAGFPVELFNFGQGGTQYNELELFSPLRLFRIGSKWRHTVTWSLSRLPVRDATSPEVAQGAGALLFNFDAAHVQATLEEQAARDLLRQADRVEVEMGAVLYDNGWGVEGTSKVVTLSAADLRPVVDNLSLRPYKNSWWGTANVPYLYFRFLRGEEKLGTLSVGYGSDPYEYWVSGDYKNRRILSKATVERLRHLVTQYPKIGRALQNWAGLKYAVND
jgi:hypothetical protein